MKRRIFLLPVLTLSILIAGLFAPPAAAITTQPLQQVAVCASDKVFLIFSPWYACLPGGNEGNPRLESLTDIFKIIFPVIESLVLAAALIAVAMIFYNIIQFILARGNSGKANTALAGIRDAVTGFIIALLSVAIVNFISGSFS